MKAAGCNLLAVVSKASLGFSLWFGVANELTFARGPGCIMRKLLGFHNWIRFGRRISLLSLAFEAGNGKHEVDGRCFDLQQHHGGSLNGYMWF